VIRVLDPGPQTTVQDLGRRGQLRYGIPPSGPVDRRSFVLANRLVGNPDDAAGLESAFTGPRFEVTGTCAMSVTGGNMPVTVNGREAPPWATIALQPGDTVKLGVARVGVRTYVAFAGGIGVSPVLGSRATYLRGRLGGFQGRALATGDVLPLGPAEVPARRYRVKCTALPDFEGEPGVRVVLGPQADRFTAEGVEAFLGGPYEMLAQSDRMGARLSGSRIGHTRGHDIISDGTALGSVQVPGDGQPIVLLVDHQSTGGYTKIATVCSFDIGRIAQTRPRQRVRFTAVEVGEAHRLRREAQRALDDAFEEAP
jgi:biotin-dependent carboxylase-like uncharacterized protein